MSMKNVMLRVAAASAATVLVTVGAVAPVNAAGQGKGAEKASSQSTIVKKSNGKSAEKKTTKAPKKSAASGKSEHSQGNASTQGAYDEPQPESKADQNSGGANDGECTETNKTHAYCSTRDGSASQNGQGEGAAKGKPAAGTVGKADNKFPKGQAPDGPTDRNAGYECDRNQGIGQGNPAHTGCTGAEDGEDNETPETPGTPGENGNGHTPVTVCHLLGNGTYLVLTFDENALDAHLGHGDLYPVPVNGCPATAPDGGNETPGGETPGGETPGGETPGTPGGNGHTPVTVCHILGNGSYIELTFDENALDAHLAHGDLYPMPADGCPAGTTSGGETPGGETPGGEIPGTLIPGTQIPGDSTQFVEQERDIVAGVEQERTTNRAPAQVTPQAPTQVIPANGILPSTGAADVLMPVVAGIALLAAGLALMTRRRPQGSR